MITSNNAQQVIIHPVPGGKMILHRYGNVFRAFIDAPEGLVEMPPEWVKVHYRELRVISSAASRTLVRCGLDVEVYGH